MASETVFKSGHGVIIIIRIVRDRMHQESKWAAPGVVHLEMFFDIVKGLVSFPQLWNLDQLYLFGLIPNGSNMLPRLPL